MSAPPSLTEEEIRRGKMKIGMALTRRRQPRKAVGTQILCKRTRSRAHEGTHLLAYIRSRTSIARRSYRADTTTYIHAPSVYTFAVIGYRLYRVQQPYGAQTRQLGMWVTYRNRALSNSIPLHRTPSSVFHHYRTPLSTPRFLRFRPSKNFFLFFW